jgi:shikimate kinase
MKQIQQQRRLVFLIGFMGSGKSYWARLLAAQANWQWVDLDTCIEAAEKSTVAEIFEARGEDAFRALEQHYLLQLIDLQQDTIVSVGGGTPCFLDNMHWMNAQGTTVYLQTAPEILVKRLLPEQQKRPLIATVLPTDLLQVITKKIAGRAPFYEQARHLIRQELGNESDVQTALAAIISNCSSNSATVISK